MTAIVPNLRVFMWLGDPFGSGSYEEITDWVRQTPEVSVRRGRPDELSSTPPGTARLVLDNRDGRFDPTYASGPYYGYLRPRTPISLRADWDGDDDRPLFYGYAVGWPQSYSAGGDAVVELDVVDVLAVLAETRPPDLLYGWLTERMLPHGGAWFRDAKPSQWREVWWPLFGFGDSSAHQVVGPPLVVERRGVSSSSVSVAGETWCDLAQSVLTSGGSWVAGVWVRIRNDVLSPVAGFHYLDAFGEGYARLSIAADGTPTYVSSESSLPGTNTVTCSRSVNDGEWHQIVLAYDSGADWFTLYIDGTATPVVQSKTGSGYPVFGIGRIFADNRDQPPIPPSNVSAMSVADLFFIDGDALTADEIGDLYDLSVDRYRESTSARADRILDAIGYPTGSAWRDFTTTPRGECWAVPTGSALQHLQAVADTEVGRLFVDNDGVIQLHSRYRHQEVTRGAVSQVTFSDDGAGVAYQSFGFDWSDLDVRNDVAVDAAGVGAAVSTDATSVTEYGVQSYPLSTLLPAVEDAQYVADGLVFWNAAPRLRARPISVTVQMETTGAPKASQPWTALLGLDLGDRVTVEITPPRGGPQIAREMLVEQIEWRITGPQWVFTVTGSPAPTGFFVLDTDELGTGLLGF